MWAPLRASIGPSNWLGGHGAKVAPSRGALRTEASPERAATFTARLYGSGRRATCRYGRRRRLHPGAWIVVERYWNKPLDAGARSGTRRDRGYTRMAFQAVPT